MKNILLPTDFSENSWNALKYALHFFEQSKCNFYILHVNRYSNLVARDSPYVPTPEIIDDLFTKPSKIKLRQLIKRIKDELPPIEGHKFYSLTDYNFFIDSVREHVYEKKIDMIVMGTKGVSGIKEIIIGSNSGDVITKVSCSTLVVPENARFTGISELAFPTDFVLSYDIQILQPIAKILERFDSFLRILHISKKVKNLDINQQKNKELLEDYFNESKHKIHFLTHIKIKDAIECFIQSRDIDMIVMVAKNLNYFQQILFHSKVEKISYHTDIPFLVLHE
jgi:nucleotide-binding universal stress UspA family protein